MSENTKMPDTPEREQRKSESSDTEHDPHFSPIIILPEVHISTNEEEEDEFLKMRAKLYRFDSQCDPPEWKERGTGELKILQHKERNSFRIVMRRDKTLKVCANHFIMPWMELKPSLTNEKAFIYTVLADFADEQSKSECLAVKFATVENANVFKSKFEDARKILNDSNVCVDEVKNGTEKPSDEESLNDSGEKADEISTQMSNLKVDEERSNETNKENNE